MKELTKNADKFVCYAYKNYLEEIKAGTPIAQAKIVPFESTITFKPFRNLHPNDIKEIISETSRAEYGEMTMECNFFISDEMIVHMENRFKKGLIEVLDTISKFIP